MKVSFFVSAVEQCLGCICYNGFMNDIQTCPVCGDEVNKDSRYPNYVCQKDAARVTDSSGKPVGLYNQDMSGGFAARYADGSTASEVDQTHEVYIDGVKYHAEEAYMGGIVITPITQ